MRRRGGIWNLQNPGVSTPLRALGNWLPEPGPRKATTGSRALGGASGGAQPSPVFCTCTMEQRPIQPHEAVARKRWARALHHLPTPLREAGEGREGVSLPLGPVSPSAYTHAGGATFLPDGGDAQGSLRGSTDPRGSARGDTAARPAREHPWSEPGRASPRRR